MVFLINLCSLWQAEAASDEVYAQVSLVPETEVSSVLILDFKSTIFFFGIRG